MARTVFHRLRDMGTLFHQFGFGLQPLRFSWALLAHHEQSSSEMTFRIRKLGGKPLHVRAGTSDLVVLYTTFGAGYDAPPEMLSPARVRRVWDLGANIGLTAAMFAAAFPNARVSAVELDAANADLARRNTKSFGSRCEILTGAIWVEDGTVEYFISQGAEQAARIGDAGNGEAALSPALSLNTLLAEDTFVDFMKMDIEGAEARVLKENTEWSQKVGCIRVEYHTPYCLDEVTADLTRLGFSVQTDSAHWASVVGTRASAPAVIAC